MRIAFYPPMKPPFDPVPSGDRQMARGLIAALEGAGHDVRVASQFRSYDRGDPLRQARLKRLGSAIARRTLRRLDRWRPEIWFTYHLYHKAPDYLGPAIASALSIPYVIAEASVANKRRDGPWAIGFEAARSAVAQADLAFGLNPADAACLLPVLRSGAIYRDLPPFLDTSLYRRDRRTRSAARRDLANRLGFAAEDDVPVLLAVAMMRRDQKLTSYRVMGAALANLVGPFRLVVVGDGPARREIETHYRELGLAHCTTFAGALPAETMADIYAGVDLLIWPAIKEAFGMVLIEAGAAGLPVVAGRSPGVAAIVTDGETGILTPEGDVTAFGRAIDALLGSADRRRSMGDAASAAIARRHDVSAASRHLAKGLHDMSEARRTAARDPS